MKLLSISAQTKKKQLLTMIPAILVIITVVVFLIIRMRQSINVSVYSERKQLLSRLTEASAGAIDEIIAFDQEIIDIVSESVAQDMPAYPDIDSYFASVIERTGFKESIFFLVDRDGKYYSSDGVSGKIVDTTYYTPSSDEKLSYISSLPHLGAEETYFIFRNRLETPVTVLTANGRSELLYCGILFGIDDLDEIVSEKFVGENNTFIYDSETGVMLYKKFGIRLLLEGYNIYRKLSQCDLKFGEKSEEIEAACRNMETVVAALKIGDEEYYFCSAPTKVRGWSIAFIIQSRYMDNVSGNSFTKIIFYISLIALILGASVISILFFIYRTNSANASLREIQKLNEDLERATNAKTEFLSNMSHDIRTPINGIMGMTTIARNVSGNPEKTVECLDKIDTASHHLLSLINDVLDMSRIERGKTEIAALPLDIRQVCENCLNIIRGQMSGRDLQLLPEIDCAHPNLIGDDLHLRQIFINILGNAVKFTPDGGSIFFRLKEVENNGPQVTIAFEIEDTGIGMKPEFLPKIFDVFTQDENGARSNYNGTGLGMAITKQLTELMGGTIAVESVPGQGSKFTVTIPFLKNSAAEEKEEIRLPDDASIRGMKILLAEDNELNMDIAVELLEDEGAILTPVENGQEAFDAFRDAAPGTFDAILMDVMMPVMNGLDATKAIRALPREDAARIPILAMTANAFENDIRATHEAGMNAHLVKPIDIKEVVRSIAYYSRKE